MKIAEAREAYYDHSGRLSDVNRQLAFAGIAVVWIFAVTSESGVSLPSELHLPLLLLVLALACDLLQYVFSTIAWGWFHRHHEKKGDANRNDNLDASRWINRPAIAMLMLKVLFNAAGLAMLIEFIWRRLA